MMPLNLREGHRACHPEPAKTARDPVKSRHLRNGSRRESSILLRPSSLFHIKVSSKHLRHFVRSLAPLGMTICLASCATISQHQFAQVKNWQTRNGQLLYRNGKTTLIGEVLVRFSKSGDFELTFSKGPGLTLLTVREDATFAEARGPIARGAWSGPIDRAPAHLRGWLALRQKIIHAQNRRSLRSTSGGETFLLRF
jgi:hypothetical protein